MDLDVILCNHAEVAENKLFLTGGGVNMCLVGPEPPHVVTLGFGSVIQVPYQATNQPHTLKITLMDEDGNIVVPFHPEGSPAPAPVDLSSPFNIGRPPMLQHGDEQTLALAANFANLPLAKTGRYVFVFAIDGGEMCRLPFRVMTPPPGFGGIVPGQPQV